ncbi:YqaA family protein [Methylocucumis oryzae]|uniref:Membrane protein n=1 Tax=Methylocucumis oryzae TaxID=1632867 RepID=A0A0F3IK37_9GAMM|nr:YqaA family protein [Methylocucumis oryzae]KJV05939.1 membrane protein [Methylocucumis oryzae]
MDNSLELLGLFISAFISATLAPGGSEALLAYLVHTQTFSINHLLLIATVGNSLGAMTTWGLGSLAAIRFPTTRVLPEKQLKALTYIKKHGLWALYFAWLPIIGDALCFAGGWLRLPYLPACALIALGKFSRYAVIAWFFA